MAIHCVVTLTTVKLLGEEVKRIATDHEISCMAEANNVLVVGQSGMECYGYLYDLNQGSGIYFILFCFVFFFTCPTIVPVLRNII